MKHPCRAADSLVTALEHTGPYPVQPAQHLTKLIEMKDEQLLYVKMAMANPQSSTGKLASSHSAMYTSSDQ